MLFQIQDITTKQYAKGSLPGPSGNMYFSKYGKVWASKQAIGGHLTLLNNPQKYYSNCIMIVIDVEKETVTRTPFSIWYAEYLVNKKVKRQ